MPAWEEVGPASAPEKEVKVQLNLGPGLSGDPETLTKIMKLNQELSKNPASVEAMKDFMSKTVEQLAASDDPAGVECLNVRGMNIVMPKGGTHRPIVILFAALTALRHPEVDRLFRELKVSTQVIEDGKVVIKRLVPDVVGGEPGPIQGISEEKPARNIIVGHPAFDPEKDRLVVAKVADKDGHMWVGVYDKGEPVVVDADGVRRFAIRPMFGDAVQKIRETDLIPIRTEAHLIEIAAQLHLQK